MTPTISRIAALAALAAALAWPALPRAEEPAPGGGLEEVRLRVGQRLEICSRSRCPSVTRCDDPRLMEVADSPAGPVLVARAPGQTVCSATGSSGMGQRWVFRLVVEAAK